MRETRKMFLFLVVVAVVGWPPTTALGQLQVGTRSEDFTTDPGWLEKNSTTSFPDVLNNEFGFRNSDLTRDMDPPNTTGAGEAGGQITRHVEAYYAADIGQIDPKTTKLMASGWVRIPGTGGGASSWGSLTDSPLMARILVQPILSGWTLTRPEYRRGFATILEIVSGAAPMLSYLVLFQSPTNPSRGPSCMIPTGTLEGARSLSTW